MSKEFSIDRIKSILEYNLRKHRYNGVEYEDGKGGSPNSSGTQYLKNDSELASWNTDKTIEFEQLDKTEYLLMMNNYNLRDAIAQTIFDLFSGKDSNNSYTNIDESRYMTGSETPSEGDVSGDGDGFTLEHDSKITLKVGDSEITIENDEIHINSPAVYHNGVITSQPPV